MAQDVSRRGFLSGMGAAALGAAAFGLAGCSPTGGEAKAESANAATGGR